MPGRHKQTPGAAAEPPLSRQQARVASATLRRLWDPTHGVPDIVTKAALVEQINSDFMQAGLSSVYTERKLSDAVSNRMYTARRKMRERTSMMRIQPMLCDVSGGGGGGGDGGDGVPIAAAAHCAAQAHVGRAASMGSCCADIHQPAATEGMPRHNDKGADVDDDSAPHYDALPGDEFFAELDIDQLPTPPSSPPTSPPSRWPMMQGRCGPASPAPAPAWAPIPVQQQSTQPAETASMGGSCMGFGAGDLPDLSAIDCHAGLSSSWDWIERDLASLARAESCVPMDECTSDAATGQCASAA
jgi:hypothetical protein